MMPFKCECGQDVPYMGQHEVAMCDCGVLFIPSEKQDLQAALKALDEDFKAYAALRGQKPLDESN